MYIRLIIFVAATCGCCLLPYSNNDSYNQALTSCLRGLPFSTGCTGCVCAIWSVFTGTPSRRDAVRQADRDSRSWQSAFSRTLSSAAACIVPYVRFPRNSGRSEWHFSRTCRGYLFIPRLTRSIESICDDTPQLRFVDSIQTDMLRVQIGHLGHILPEDADMAAGFR